MVNKNMKNSADKVMKIFFDAPEKKFHIREIARLTKLSPTTISTITKSLEKEDLLERKKTKVFEYVKAARNRKFIIAKKYYNLKTICETGLVGFLRDKYEEPEAIILFGSYSKGGDISKSDIDIAVVTKKSIDTDLSKYEKKLKRKISIHEIQIKKAEKEFLNELANGIILYGYLKVV